VKYGIPVTTIAELFPLGSISIIPEPLLYFLLFFIRLNTGFSAFRSRGKQNGRISFWILYFGEVAELGAVFDDFIQGAPYYRNKSA